MYDHVFLTNRDLICHVTNNYVPIAIGQMVVKMASSDVTVAGKWHSPMVIIYGYINRNPTAKKTVKVNTNLLG